MKILITTLLFAVSTLSFASSMSGSTSRTPPPAPCYVSGEYVGTMPITDCLRQDGSPYKDR
ncbi:hypothetical protein GT360_20795 [Vibrio astriarenae]|uniref:Uncharacterized protein n=1 Tax=Vibrio astriarenae TaxID=1481923 RepID=A0A7Z2YFZ2_9VIBR|nr:hypothetical protein [Vibrio astriarenae]QIA65941.1 hypothetical protein GT360_20795 [Vibrio astriarenae]